MDNFGLPDEAPDFNPDEYFKALQAKPNVEFFYRQKRNGKKSAEQGVPIFDDVETVRIYRRNNEYMDRTVTPEDKVRYAEQYAAFKAGSEQPLSGTPIEQCHPIPRTIAETFKAIGFRTVEQLATADPTRIGAVPEAQRFQAEAKAWLLAGRSRAKKTALIKENDELRKEIAYLKDQIAAVNKRFEEMKKEPN